MKPNRETKDFGKPAYRYEISDAYPTSTNISAEIERLTLGRRELPKAFVWDDMILHREKSGRMSLRRFEWPKPEPILCAQLSSAGRCAISVEVMEQLQVEGKISSAKDTSAALKILAAEQPDSIELVPELLRYVGSRTGCYETERPLAGPSHSPRKVSVILSYQDQTAYTIETFRSVCAQKTSVPLEIFLVNHDSLPESKRLIERYIQTILPTSIEYQHVDPLADETLNAQLNRVASIAKGDVLLFINHEAKLLSKGLIEDLARWALEPNVGTVGVRKVSKENKLVSSGMSITTFAVKGKKEACTTKEFAIEPLSEVTRETVGSSFNCVAVAREAWNQLEGLKDKDFPNMNGDADFALRALEKGFRNLYLGGHKIENQPGAPQRTKSDVQEFRMRLFEAHPKMGQYRRRATQISSHTQTDFQSLKIRSLIQYTKVLDKIAEKNSRFIPLSRKLIKAGFMSENSLSGLRS